MTVALTEEQAKHLEAIEQGVRLAAVIASGLRPEVLGELRRMGLADTYPIPGRGVLWLPRIES